MPLGALQIQLSLGSELQEPLLIRKYIHNLALFFILCILVGCEDPTPDRADEYLIRVGGKVVTVLDFNNAFEIVKTAYPHDIRQNPEEILKAQLRLLNQMAVEILILKRAEDLGIGLSDAEFEKIVDSIKADYPDGTFEETLLEFAVSYEAWENRLKTRLIIDKVIEKDLNERITITPADISKYYEENYKGRESDLSEHGNSQNINEAIILRLRRQKTEEAYKMWVNELRDRYLIETNSALWEKMTGMKSISLDDLNTEKPKLGTAAGEVRNNP